MAAIMPALNPELRLEPSLFGLEPLGLGEDPGSGVQIGAHDSPNKLSPDCMSKLFVDSWISSGSYPKPVPLGPGQGAWASQLRLRWWFALAYTACKKARPKMYEL